MIVGGADYTNYTVKHDERMDGQTDRQGQILMPLTIVKGVIKMIAFSTESFFQFMFQLRNKENYLRIFQQPSPHLEP